MLAGILENTKEMHIEKYLNNKFKLFSYCFIKIILTVLYSSYRNHQNQPNSKYRPRRGEVKFETCKEIII